jgi:hypothetical protein
MVESQGDEKTSEETYVEEITPNDDAESMDTNTFYTPISPSDKQFLEPDNSGREEAQHESSSRDNRVDMRAVTDVSQCIEEIGYGNYQWKVAVVMGLMTFGDACMIWLSAIIISKTN